MYMHACIISHTLAMHSWAGGLQDQPPGIWLTCEAGLIHAYFTVVCKEGAVCFKILTFTTCTVYVHKAAGCNAYKVCMYTDIHLSCMWCLSVESVQLLRPSNCS